MSGVSAETYTAAHAAGYLVRCDGGHHLDHSAHTRVGIAGQPGGGCLRLTAYDTSASVAGQGPYRVLASFRVTITPDDEWLAGWLQSGDDVPDPHGPRSTDRAGRLQWAAAALLGGAGRLSDRVDAAAAHRGRRGGSSAGRRLRRSRRCVMTAPGDVYVAAARAAGDAAVAAAARNTTSECGGSVQEYARAGLNAGAPLLVAAELRRLAGDVDGDADPAGDRFQHGEAAGRREVAGLLRARAAEWDGGRS